jgi:hypothetical protein
MWWLPIPSCSLVTRQAFPQDICATTLTVPGIRDAHTQQRLDKWGEDRECRQGRTSSFGPKRSRIDSSPTYEIKGGGSKIST